jgi:hypothetical protein
MKTLQKCTIWRSELIYLAECKAANLENASMKFSDFLRQSGMQPVWHAVRKLEDFLQICEIFSNRSVCFIPCSPFLALQSQRIVSHIPDKALIYHQIESYFCFDDY